MARAAGARRTLAYAAPEAAAGAVRVDFDVPYNLHRLDSSPADHT